MPEHDEGVGARIRARRKLLGMSQKALAVKLKMAQPQLSDWERGRFVPDRTNLVRLSDALKVTVDDLLDNRARPDLLRHEASGRTASLPKAGANAPPTSDTRVLEDRISALTTELEQTKNELATARSMLEQFRKLIGGYESGHRAPATQVRRSGTLRRR